MIKIKFISFKTRMHSGRGKANGARVLATAARRRLPDSNAHSSHHLFLSESVVGTLHQYILTIFLYDQMY